MDVLLAASVALFGALAALGVECLLKPRPTLFRPLAAQAVHFGLWLAMLAALLMAVQRIGFAVALALAFWLLVVLVSNAKRESLREPFVFMDFDYFTDALRHPRLYLPFLGISRAVLAVLAFVLVVYAGWRFEPPLAAVAWTGLSMAGLAAGLLWAGTRKLPKPTLHVEADLRNWGLAASLWAYAWAERDRLPQPLPTPFVGHSRTPRFLPDLVAVQSESFFDARRLAPGIRGEVLAEFDALCRASACSGRLAVPAWGANTVRTEFAFLTGMPEQSLGVHRFKPYRQVLGGPVAGLAAFLRGLGYRTVCVHPYPASFYARDRVFPNLGFDEFIDIRAFGEGGRVGAYVGDAAVADKILEVLDGAAGPVFVFAITMENHGPLHLESVAPGEAGQYFDALPPAAYGDSLTAYLRHLRNADRMLAGLRRRLGSRSRESWLCFYGDHVPILPQAYAAMGYADGRTEYVLWGSGRAPGGRREDLAAHELGLAWLREAGLLPAGD